MKNLNSVQDMTPFPSPVEPKVALSQVKSFKRIGAYASIATLGAYAVHLMSSAGAPGFQEKNLMAIALALTLLVIIPIIVLNIHSISRLRVSNATTEPASGYVRSIKKEMKAWAAPIGIVALVTVLGWSAIHSLDLYKPIESKAAQEHVATVAGD